ncbi:hypothetical protein BX600DRAFT_448799 [Xylariales sp. PMI_506]|nr:hypothetical protein BX600DRAFT_448799 [Xylariales sp. PMI_506]
MASAVREVYLPPRLPLKGGRSRSSPTTTTTWSMESGYCAKPRILESKPPTALKYVLIVRNPRADAHCDPASSANRTTYVGNESQLASYSSTTKPVTQSRPVEKHGMGHVALQGPLVVRNRAGVGTMMEGFNRWYQSRLMDSDTSFKNTYANSGISESPGQKLQAEGRQSENSVEFSNRGYQGETRESGGSGKESCNKASGRREQEDTRAGTKRSNIRRDGDEDDDGGSKKPKTVQRLSERYACPFFKRDPVNWSGRGACTGPGWSSIARLKEHIYRVHRLPKYQCPRCYLECQDSSELQNHQRAANPCRVVTAKRFDGIDDVQYERLRKKKSGNDQAAWKKWEEIYRIIFPSANVIPSPYYDYTDDRPNQSLCLDHDVQSQLLSRLQDSLERSCSKNIQDVAHQVVDLVKHHLEIITVERLHPQGSPYLSPPLPLTSDAEESLDNKENGDMSLIFDEPSTFPLPNPLDSSVFKPSQGWAQWDSESDPTTDSVPFQPFLWDLENSSGFQTELRESFLP